MKLKEYLKDSHFTLTYSDALLLFTNIGEEMKSLEQNGVVIYALSLNDIIRDKNKFSISKEKINSSKQKKVSIKKKDFTSPEIDSSMLSEKSGIYSLASLVAYCLTGKKDIEKKFKELETIRETKLYWALKRALRDKKRQFF